MWMLVSLQHFLYLIVHFEYGCVFTKVGKTKKCLFPCNVLLFLDGATNEPGYETENSEKQNSSIAGTGTIQLLSIGVCTTIMCCMLSFLYCTVFLNCCITASLWAELKRMKEVTTELINSTDTSARCQNVHALLMCMLFRIYQPILVLCHYMMKHAASLAQSTLNMFSTKSTYPCFRNHFHVKHCYCNTF